MSVSGSRSPVDIDLDEFEKRLRTAGTPTGAVEDPLAELARLVEASRPKGPGALAPQPVRAVAPVVARPPLAPPRPVAPPHPVAPPRPVAEPEPVPELESSSPLLEAGALRPALDDAADQAPEVVGDFDPAQAHAYAPFADNLSAAEPERPRSRRWLVTVSVLAIAGVAMIGAVLALKGGVPGLSKAPPFIAAANGPTKVQPPTDATVATANDAGASLLKDNTHADHVKVVANQEQPVDIVAQTAQPPAPVAAPNAAAATGSEAPLVVPTPAPAPASPFPEAKPVRTISLRPDGTPISAAAAAAAPAQSEIAAPVNPQPAKPAAKTPVDAGNAQASTPKIDLPTKLSGKSSARVVVAKTDTTADAPGEPVQLGGAGAKPAKAKAQEAAAAPVAAAAEPSAATSSSGWAVQLAAPRSESEARSVLNALKDKYASALGGMTLGVHKATVHGDTIYRVRVTGLSKADAAQLCARVKGDGGQCFVAK